MECGPNGVCGVNAPRLVNSEHKAEAESATIPLQLTAIKTAKDRLNNPASVMRTCLVQVRFLCSPSLAPVFFSNIVHGQNTAKQCLKS